MKLACYVLLSLFISGSILANPFRALMRSMDPFNRAFAATIVTAIGAGSHNLVQVRKELKHLEELVLKNS